MEEGWFSKNISRLGAALKSVVPTSKRCVVIQNNKRLIDFKVENGRFKKQNGSSIDFTGKNGSSFIDFIDENAATDYSGSDINSSDQEWASCSNELLEVPHSIALSQLCDLGISMLGRG